MVRPRADVRDGDFRKEGGGANVPHLESARSGKTEIRYRTPKFYGARPGNPRPGFNQRATGLPPARRRQRYNGGI